MYGLELSDNGIMGRVLVAPLLAVTLCGCPSLDGFAGDGGSDVTTETAADGGSGGGYLSTADAVRFCSRALTCPNLQKSTQISLDIPVDGANFAACVSWLTSALPPSRVGVTQARTALECASQASSCSNASGCMWFEFVSPSDPRCVGYAGGNFGACSPNLASTYLCDFGFIAHCDNPFNYTGSSCLKGSGGYYFCAVSSGLCATADGGAPPPSCSGSFFEYCNEGFLVGYDCEVQGETCGLDPGSKQYACLSGGHFKSCPTAGQVACSGDLVQSCDGLTLSEFDCAALGGTCDGSGAVPRCALPTDTCSPYDGTSNVCTADVVSLCVNGQPASFDCTSVGMHCVAGSGKITAHCE